MRLNLLLVLIGGCIALFSYAFPLQDLMLKASASLAFFVWTNELLPLDILLLALIDRDDDTHALRIVVCTYSQTLIFDCIFLSFSLTF